MQLKTDEMLVNVDAINCFQKKKKKSGISQSNFGQSKFLFILLEIIFFNFIF